MALTDLELLQLVNVPSKGSEAHKVNPGLGSPKSIRSSPARLSSPSPMEKHNALIWSPEGTVLLERQSLVNAGLRALLDAEERRERWDRLVHPEEMDLMD